MNLEVYQEVMKLSRDGMRICDIVKSTGLSRSCVNNWIRRTNVKYAIEELAGFKYKMPLDIDPIKALGIITRNNSHEIIYKQYSFLLGLYLGDGCLYQLPRTVQLSIALDSKYAKMNSQIAKCFEEFFGKSPCIHDLSIKRNQKTLSNSISIKYSNVNLPIIFPQHGRGRKHLRKIELAEWQKNIIVAEEIIKGLIYSDGCYSYRSKRKSYHYEFANKSIDIIEIFVKYLSELNIHYSILDKKNIYRVKIDRVEDVSRLFSIIGSKDFPKIT